ncbi:hypothetical protein, partial [Amycolatopsis sp. NPDC051372]|uniref:hypothetical protein n=1 Tax=Amycolatopsis sp. NPDC051372 TaxID=3155669 RepID=UPI0034250C18
MTTPDAVNTPRHEHAFVPGVLSAADATARAFKRALTAWAQGDILEGVGLFWATPHDVDLLTGISAARGVGTSYPVYSWDGQAADENISLDPADWSNALSIITSQTCDIAPAGPGARHHTVQVSPLVSRVVSCLTVGWVSECGMANRPAAALSLRDGDR